MTIDEFIEAMPTDGWYLDGELRLRRMPDAQPWEACAVECDCPVTAVSKQLHPELAVSFDVSCVIEAAEVMGLPISDADRIVLAADCRATEPSFDPALRRRLLERAGLA